MDRRSIDSNVRRSRAIFLSDMHLATPSCRADILLDFLHHHDADTIYLVGDILDFWRVKRRSVWPQSHGDVVRVLLEKARDGARLLFIPGKHDEGLREYCGTRLGGIEVARDCVHTTANGRRLLVVHGNEPQINVRFARWLRFLSNSGRIGLWSLSSHLRRKAKTWLNLISSFEQALAEEARRRRLDGVVCGHIHHAAHRDIGGIEYLNCGDWIDSCTAIAEDPHGSLKIINWLQKAEPSVRA